MVTYQLKILTTAIFSWVLLGRRLSLLHWVSLALLMTGVSLVQIEESIEASPINAEFEETIGIHTTLSREDKTKLNRAHPNPEVSWLLGVLAVLISCLSSGFSGVYFERLVKRGKNLSLLIRNIQLGLFSILFSLMAVYVDSRQINEEGFFQGYTVSTWAVITIQAFGGLIVSVTMKYADNILKGFATSLSIVMSTLISWALLGDKAPTLQFLIGASIVIGATFLYGSAANPSRNESSSTRLNSTEDLLKIKLEIA